ncbi:MAG: HAD family phosphatase [Deltaproteobacteria bacterium]|nr:HAD family phosphatase [Deltaproteobacteria bacterium]
MRHYDAAVFDLDGTLVDNIPWHLQAWVEMGRKLGADITPERFEREFSGRRNEEIFPAVAGRPLDPSELSLLAAEKEARYRALYAPHLRLLEGADALLQRLSDRAVACAIASAAPADNRAFVLGGLQLHHRFAAVVGAEAVQRGKPHPDLFLAAASAVDIPPARCLAFEDAVLGVQAARAAGMDVVALTTTTSAAALTEAGARWTAPHFAALPAEVFARLGL